MPETPSKKSTPFPSKDDVLEFVRDSKGDVGKREIARAFAIRGADRTRLNDLLRELRDEGELDRGKGRRFREPGTLPSVTVIEVAGTDSDGDPVARPVSWDEETPPPQIYLAPERGRGAAPGIGDRLLVRLTANRDGSYTARVMKRLARAPERLLGVYDVVGGRGRVSPTDRRIRAEFSVPAGRDTEASRGDLVLIETLPGRHYGLREAKIVEIVGRADGPRAPSVIAIHANDIPTEFTAEALADAEAAGPVPVDARTDLRDLPLVTIDGADARDFDDAVWAEPDVTGDGWHLVVAIADVAWYVRPGAPLDRCAFERGNSVYFPDRVVPMLPEPLSNGWCSLVPREDRGCLAVHMWIDAAGNLHRHSFVRGIMRSAARLTYEQVQAARDGRPDGTTGPLAETVIAPLYGAFEALLTARNRRGTIDLELPERRVEVDADGNVVGIRPLVRLDSHRLIEEFMIAANVAAAETLERAGVPCMYRVHDRPSPEKFEALRVMLGEVGIRIAKGQVVRPETFRRIVERAADTPHARMVNESVLRAQAQAIYSPDNIGHFGLALRRYAHFTSPIRRYADLLVHRALIAAHGLGDDGLRPDDAERFAGYGAHISVTERRAVKAEREAVDRFTVVFLADSVGAEFAARINGVHRAGLFVTLVETGADGLVPMSLLGDDRFELDHSGARLRGRRSGQTYALGDAITVRLEEANVHTGSLAFSVTESGRRRRPVKPAPRGKPGRARKKHSKSKG